MKKLILLAAVLIFCSSCNLGHQYTNSRTLYDIAKRKALRSSRKMNRYEKSPVWKRVKKNLFTRVNCQIFYSMFADTQNNKIPMEKILNKYPVRYRAGELSGAMVIRAASKDQVESKLWDELKLNHAKLPDRSSLRVQHIDDKQINRLQQSVSAPRAPNKTTRG